MTVTIKIAGYEVHCDECNSWWAFDRRSDADLYARQHEREHETPREPPYDQETDLSHMRDTEESHDAT